MRFKVDFSLATLFTLSLFAAIPRAAALGSRRCQLRSAHSLQVENGTQPSLPGSPSATTSREAAISTSSVAQPAATTSTTTDVPPLPPFRYGQDTIRGVNLGGWFVLEPWITPSFFERTNNSNVIDEFTLGNIIDRDTALEMLEQHWKTWITEDDFAAIRNAGLTHVRIPLGYWSVPLSSDDTRTTVTSEPFVPGAWPHLLKGLTWARQHGLRVIIDLHGAPGSQNGYDNSGQLTSNPQWALNPDFLTHTVDVLRFVAANVGGMIDVLELLNEPAGFRGEEWARAVRQLWLDGYDAVNEVAGGDLHVMIGEAFMGMGAWAGFLTPPRGEGVLMDFHEYQIFSDRELNRNNQEHIDFACGHIETLSNYASSNLWTVIGEWSNAITDCARWLNGRGVGARWDGTHYSTDQYHGSCEGYTGSYSNFSEEYKSYLRRYWEVQVEIGENIQGWIFWTWKAENADEWSYQKGLEGGWIPQDPTDRLHPNICSGT